jgi:hypothetical protein
MDGQPAPVGRAALTLETLRVMVHVGPWVAAFVGEWMQSEMASQGPVQPGGTAQG